MPEVTLTLPDFIILGANKAGTTSLARYLSQHPDIWMSAMKEPMFFTADPLMVSATPSEATLADPFFTTDLDSYSEQFTGSEEVVKAYGEASTAYLCNPRVAAPAIKKIVPRARLIAVLRDPVDRAVSAYKMAYGSGLEARDFHQVVVESSTHTRILHRQGVKEFVRNGLYGQQIEIYLKYFAREQMLFLKYDEFLQDACHCLTRICSFISVPESAFDTTVKHNRAADHLRKDVTIKKEDCEALRELFREDMERTGELTGLDLKDWQGR